MSFVLECFNKYNHNEKGYCEHCKSSLQEKCERLEAENARLREFINLLKTGDCWCDEGCGNPMICEHSRICIDLKKYMEESK